MCNRNSKFQIPNFTFIIPRALLFYLKACTIIRVDSRLVDCCHNGEAHGITKSKVSASSYAGWGTGTELIAVAGSCRTVGFSTKFVLLFCLGSSYGFIL